MHIEFNGLVTGVELAQINAQRFAYPATDFGVSSRRLPHEPEGFARKGSMQLGGFAGLTALTMGISQDKALAATNNLPQMNLPSETPAANGVAPNGQI
jgi:hypothetical protein